MQYVFPPLNAHDGCMYGNVSHLVFCGVRVTGSLVFSGVRVAGSLVFRGVRVAGSLVFSGVRVAGSLVFRGVSFLCSVLSNIICPSWPLCCLSSDDLRFLLPPLVSSIFS